MVFYQQTLSAVTPELLIDALFQNCENPNILYLHFNDTPETVSIHDALCIIDKKRQSLINPHRHSFLCLELTFPHTPDIDTAKAALNYIAAALNTAFHDDLFLINLLYRDEHNSLHPVIIISDIERSLPESSQFLLTAEVLLQVLIEQLPEFNIDSIAYKVLYAFSGAEAELAYDGVIHFLQSILSTISFIKLSHRHITDGSILTFS